MIKPTINGVLSIIRSCTKAKTVKRLVFTSSAGTVNGQEHQQPLYDENNWSDLDFIYAKKMTGWVSIYTLIFADFFHLIMFSFFVISEREKRSQNLKHLRTVSCGTFLFGSIFRMNFTSQLFRNHF